MFGDETRYPRWLLNSLLRCYRRLTVLYSLLDAVNTINFKLKTWFGIWNSIWNLGLESEIFHKKRWDFESFVVVVPPNRCQ